MLSLVGNYVCLTHEKATDWIESCMFMEGNRDTAQITFNNDDLLVLAVDAVDEGS